MLNTILMDIIFLNLSFSPIASNIFHLLTGHMDFLLCKLLVHILCPFLRGVDYFLLSCSCSLYTTDRNPVTYT